MMRCSVVIPTYQRPDLLSRVLDALATQTLAPDEFEIIVCDDAGSEETRALVERWRDAHPISISYINGPTPKQGPAAMRNAGWRRARGEVIAFTDDDTVPDPDWLRQGLLALADDAADAASGRIVVPLPDDPTDYERDTARLEGAGFVTANCFCRRATLQSVGGFDPRFRTAWREDSDLFFKLIKSGFDVVHALDAVVVHPVRPAPWGVSLRAESKHVFDALLYKKHPDLYVQFIRPDRPHLYYAILAALALGLTGAIDDSFAVTVAGLVSWLVLTAVLVLRRLRATKRTWSHVAEIIVTSTLIPLLSVYHRVRGGVAFRVAFW
jgi:glycosyltransferase involved in cell wall biosynthesis